MDSKLLTELVCTRLSHDIVGNVGAVANAVELLEEGDMDFLDDIKSILKTSSSVLSARMRFFRMAFGVENANLEKADVLEKTIRDYLATIGNRNYPIEFNFSLNTFAFARPLLLAVMIVADMLVRGGRITVAEQEQKLWIASEGTTPPSADKMKQLKDIFSGDLQEANAQLAPSYSLLNMAEKGMINIYLLKSEFPGFMIELKGRDNG